MEFRPCIDIHNGAVKQIVGSSLRDAGNKARENFVSERGARYYAHYYKERNLPGGHIILLNPVGSAYYDASYAQAIGALREYPDGMQIGGGITADNAAKFLCEGASHVIVTSYVFRDGKIDFGNLKKLVSAVGRERIVLDVSCRKKGGDYYVVTDRWQKFTSEKLTVKLLHLLAEYADEFLVHAVDVEGTASGIEWDVAALLGNFGGIPVTYAGGVSTLDDIRKLKELGGGRVNVTVGSALDLFGGPLALDGLLAVICE